MMGEEETLYLPQIPRLTGGPAFRAFLREHQLTIVDVALAAQMRLMPVWQLWQNRPIKLREAQAIRETLYRLTGAYFTAPVAIASSEWQAAGTVMGNGEGR